MSPFPSAVQIGLLRPPARGGALSPIMNPSISKSKSAVRFRGFAFGERSSTHRSGSVYELMGWFVSDKCDLSAVGAKSQRASARSELGVEINRCDLYWFA